MTETEIVERVAQAIWGCSSFAADGHHWNPIHEMAPVFRREAAAAIAALKGCGFVKLERETVAKALFETAAYDTEVWPPSGDDRKALYLDDAEEIIKHLTAKVEVQHGA